MKSRKHNRRDNKSLKQATLCFLLKGDKVLLGMKKRGFATGKWNGFGGKNDEGEDIQDTAIREVQEELGVKVKSLDKVATLDCYHPDWGQRVFVYLATEWEEEPEETEEMRPEWFSRENIPYSKMWEDSAIWLPLILGGKKIKANLIIGADGELVEKEIVKVNKFYD